MKKRSFILEKTIDLLKETEEDCSAIMCSRVFHPINPEVRGKENVIKALEKIYEEGTEGIIDSISLAVLFRETKKQLLMEYCGYTKSYRLTWQNLSETISCSLNEEEKEERGKLVELLVGLSIKIKSKSKNATEKERYRIRLIKNADLILEKDFNEATYQVELSLPVEFFQGYLKQYLGISSLEELERSIKSGKELKEFLKSAHLPARSLIENLGFKGAKKTDVVLNKLLWNTYLTELGRKVPQMDYSKYDEKEKTLKSLQIKRENNEVKLLFEKYACEFPCSRPETKKLLSKYEWSIDRTGVNLSYSMPLHLTPEPEIIEIEKSLKEKCQIAITALMSLFDEKDLKLKTWTR